MRIELENGTLTAYPMPGMQSVRRLDGEEAAAAPLRRSEHISRMVSCDPGGEFACAHAPEPAPSAEPMLSVCAICYNNLRYIRRWAASIIEQQADFAIEVVITDDSSTDGSWEMLAEAKQQLERVGIACRLLRNERNMGVGPTRHRSLEAARGKYVLFLDGDDAFCGAHSFQLIVEAAERLRTDCVMFGTCGASAAWACGGVCCETTLYSARAACAAALNRNISIVVWDKLWRREAIADVAYPQLRSNEDTVATPLWLWHCSRGVAQVPVIGYRYEANPQSLTHTYCRGGDPGRRQQHLECVRAAIAALKCFFKENDPELYDYAATYYLHSQDAALI